MGAIIWAIIPGPVKRALAWLAVALGAVWAIRLGAKREARQEAALDAAKGYAKTRKEIDHADTPSDDPAVLREWLRSRDPSVK